MKVRPISQLAAALLLSMALAGCATNERSDVGSWPERVVSVDEMKLLAPIQMRFIHSSKEKSGLLTTVLVVHVDAQGKTVRSRIEQSSGLPRLDEAAKVAVLEARFAPYLVDGAAQDVSVVMPMHVPVKKL